MLRTRVLVETSTNQPNNDNDSRSQYVKIVTTTSISSYFNQSPMRVAELEKIASDNNLKVKNLPKIFEIRWTQFSFALLRNVLFSWKLLVLYFDKNKKEAACAGYHLYLTKLENLKMIAFVADVLLAFQRFQKQLQSDCLTIVSLMPQINAIKKTLSGMETTPILGAFKSKLSEKVTNKADGKVFLKSIELQESTSSRQKLASFSELQKDILNSIQTYLDERFGADESFLQKITPFNSFRTDADVKAIHELVAPDVSLPNLSFQFQDMTNIPELKSYSGLSLKEILHKLAQTAESRENYKELITVLARITACTPHSANVERCISSNNRLKTKLRSGLKVDTENKYILIHPL